MEVLTAFNPSHTLRMRNLLSFLFGLKISLFDFLFSFGVYFLVFSRVCWTCRVAVRTETETEKSLIKQKICDGY